MKKTLSCFLFAAALNSTCTLHAQVPPSIQWQRSLGGSNFDNAYSVEQTTDGGFIVAGFSNSTDGDITNNHGNYDYWVVRLDSTGNMMWEKSYGGSDDDEAYSVEQTTDGGFVVAGFSYSNDGDVTGNHGGDDYWIMKLDTDGNLVWQKSLGGSSLDEAYSINLTTDHGFIVAGVSHSNNDDASGNHGGGDYWIVRLDSVGNLIWQKSLGGSQYDIAESVQQTTDGGFIVTGWAKSFDGDVTGNHGNYDYWTVKLDSIGNLTWEKSYGGNTYDQPFSVQQTADGGFIVAGFAYSTDGDVTGNHGPYDYWILKLDTAGNLEWQKCLGGTATDRGYSVQQTSDGGFIAAGYATSTDGDVTINYGGEDVWVVKLDADGNLVWQKSFGGSYHDVAYAIRQTTDGGFIVGGWSYSNDVDVSGNHGNDDYWIVKLTSDVATGITSPLNPLVSLYPNPVQTQLNINLTTSVNEITIRVFDIEGRTFNLPISNLKSQTSNSLQINTSILSNGFYTLQIINNKTGEIQSGKFVKQE